MSCLNQTATQKLSSNEQLAHGEPHLVQCIYIELEPRFVKVKKTSAFENNPDKGLGLYKEDL